MDKIIYYIDCRDADNKPFVKSNGRMVGEIRIEREYFNPYIVEKDCEDYCTDFQALTKCDNVNIDVRYFNDNSKTYPLLYSYYGREKRFVKHD